MPKEMDDNLIRQNQHTADDGISLRDLIINIIGWFKYFWKKKLLIILTGLLGAAIGLTIAIFSKPKYVAELNFAVEDNSSGGLGAYSGLASQFGIDLSPSGSSFFTGDNIVQLLQSRLLIESTLLSGHAIYNGKEMSLANLYIEFNDLRRLWKDTTLKRINYPINADRGNFTRKQDSILNIIQKDIAKKYLEVTKPDKKLAFISAKCISLDEAFSKAFTERLVDEAIDLYISTKTSKNRTNVDKLQVQADSLKQQLDFKTYSVAKVQDLNANPARQMAGVSTELATRDKLILQTMYGEVIKNLELSKLAMVQETPIIQIIDKPILPLEKKTFSKTKGVALGGLVGAALMMAFLLLRRYSKIFGII